MPDDYGRRMTMDSRMVREIERSSGMSAEQGSGWLSEWGGPVAYRYWAKQPVADRMTYFAIQEGYTAPEDIAAVTDLGVKDVNKSIRKLEKQGVITGVAEVELL